MKVLIVISLMVSLAMCQIAPPERPPTMTNKLHDAQEELLWGHEFAEEFILQNRQLLSDYLERIEVRVIADFMDAYAAIKNIALDTRRIMNETYPEPSFCKDLVRNRWELQVRRYGQKLSTCLGVADGYIKRFTDTLNALHVESRVYSNVIPNCGVHVLADQVIYDNKEDVPQFINDRFRDLIFRALDRYAQFENFISDISVDLDALVDDYTRCYRRLPEQFQAESDEDLDRIRLCYGD